MKKLFAFFILIALICADAGAQSVTVGLMLNDTSQAWNGYTLFAPKQNTMTYLIDNKGRIINEWTASDYPPGQSVYLLENGDLLRTCMVPGQLGTGGGEGGRVERYDWNDSLVWYLNWATTTYMQHHDIRKMPNGNILMLVVEKKSYAEVIAAGFNPARLNPEVAQKGFMLPDHIVEIQPTWPSGGIVVWEWHVWDHLIQDYDATKANYGVVSAHPELIDCDGDGRMLPVFWNHMNSIDYNPTLDQIVVSVRGNSELWVIDHSTTTAQAAGHSGGLRNKGGDLLYRWGNPKTYGAGTAASQKYFEQHDVEWVRSGCPGEGNLTCYNNGIGRTPPYSTVDEITPPVDSAGNYTIVTGSAFGPAGFTWSYTATPPTALYSANISGAQRLPNGNTLICEGGHGEFTEVTSAGVLVWKYVNPVTSTGPTYQGDTLPTDPSHPTETMNSVFRVYRYAPGYAAFAGRDMTPGKRIEYYSHAPMLLITADTFSMGDHYGFADPGHPSDEVPIHSVKVDSFLISPYELTNREFCIFLNEMNSGGLITVADSSVYLTGDSDMLCETGPAGVFTRILYNGSYFYVTYRKKEHPMVCVRWHGAIAYCNWLSLKNGYEPCYDLSTSACDFTKNGYRLPTEAEWEYAARGGNKTPYYNFPNGNVIVTNQANLPASGDPYETGTFPNTTPAGFYDGTLKQKSKYSWPGSAVTYQTSNGVNGFGLYDMQGNAWELINDWYGQNYYAVSPSNNPTGPASGTIMPDGKAYRGMRGGNWYNGLVTGGINDGHSRVSNRNPSYYRGPQDPDHPWYHIGFRIARSYATPDRRSLLNMTIPDGSDTCFGATQTITLAGSGHTFMVQSGGSVTLVAGQRVLMLPATHVQPGGVLHAWISETGDYCNMPAAAMPYGIVTGEETRQEDIASTVHRFHIWPNPVTDGFRLVRNDQSAMPEQIEIVVYEMTGRRIICEAFTGMESHEISMKGRPSGLYLVRIRCASGTESFRIIKK